LQFKERDNLGNKLEKILRFRRTSLSQDNCAATHAALENDDNLNSLSNNQLFHSGRGPDAIPTQESIKVKVQFFFKCQLLQQQLTGLKCNKMCCTIIYE